jgi:divalent metal cation (Fe/Co/Zn/Cd) transporter
MLESLSDERGRLVERGQRLEYFTILWNSLETLASLIAGIMAGSVALVGFGLDSLIEVTSGTTLLWRLRRDQDAEGRERIERVTLRIVGTCFLALAAYITYQSLDSLVRRRAPERSVAGIAIAAAALIAMPLLARAKRHVSAGIRSGAMAADARQADFCAYLSAILLGGLALNALFSWWWADPAAALAMVPIIAREGIAGWQGRGCDECP